MKSLSGPESRPFVRRPQMPNNDKGTGSCGGSCGGGGGSCGCDGCCSGTCGDGTCDSCQYQPLPNAPKQPVTPRR